MTIATRLSLNQIVFLISSIRNAEGRDTLHMRKFTFFLMTAFLTLSFLLFSCDDTGGDPFYKSIVLKDGDSLYEVTFVREGETYTFPSPSSRSGYRFYSWTGDDMSYDSGDIITVTSDMTFSALWGKVTTVTIDYGMEESETVETFDGRIMLPHVPFRDGYVFSYWKVGDNTYTSSEEIEVSGDDVTVTAVWTKLGEAALDDGISSSSSVLKEDGGKITLPKAPERTGYHFNGWVADGALYKSGDSICYTSGLVISASWSKIYAVTINYDDGNGTMESIENIGSDYTFPSSPARKGYSFRCWSLDGKTYSAGAKTTIDGDVTITALWDSIYTVTIDYNDGRGKEYAENIGESLTLPEEPSQKGADVFAGWEVEGKIFEAGDVVTVNGDIEIKALWSPYFTVTVDYDTTVLTWLEMQSTSVKKGGKYTLPKVPATESHYFSSWTVTEEGKEPSGGHKSGEEISVSSNISLKAVWKERINKYTVSFNTNGGTPSSIASYEGLEGFKVYLSETPTKPGYTLASWVTGKGKTFDISEDLIIEDTCLTAQWKETNLSLSVKVPEGILNIDSIKVRVADSVTQTFSYPSDGTSEGGYVIFSLPLITGKLDDKTDYVIALTTCKGESQVGDTVYDSVRIDGVDTSKTVMIDMNSVEDITPSVTTRAVVDDMYREKVMASIVFADGTRAYYTTDGSEATVLSTEYRISGEEFEVPSSSTVRVFVSADSIRDRLIKGDVTVTHAGITSYTIGATGPHGGIIFYDNGEDSTPWRFLEAAPADFVYEGKDTFIFGPNGSVSTGEACGKGYDNTINISNTLSKTSYAAYKVCQYYSAPGDGGAWWYVPSVRELELMKENLYLNGLGNFESTFYWSSSTLYQNNEDDTAKAYQIRFYDSTGYEKYEAERSTEARIRPITRF